MDEHEVTKRLSAQHSMMETSIARKNIESHAPYSQAKRWTALAILVILTIIVISLLYLFRTTPERIFVTTIKANTLVYNNSKNFGTILFGGTSQTISEKYVTSQLVEEGDILFTENFCFAFDSKTDTLQVSERDSVLYINGNLAGIYLDSGLKFLPPLKKLPSDSIEHLQILIVESPIRPGYLPELKRIAEHHKTVSVCIEGDCNRPDYKRDIKTIAKLFNPDLLFVDLNGMDLAVLSQFKTVKTLILSFTGPYDKALPAMPNLRHCILHVYDTGFINRGLFKENKQLDKLTIKGDDKILKCMPVIQNLPQLKELSVDRSEFFDIDSVYQNAPQLRTLIVGDSCKNIAAISKFKELKWLGLPVDISQKDFEIALRGLPQLQVLEFYGNDSIKNLSSILKLNDLKGLVIANQLPDSSRLFEFRQLRYLSIPEKQYGDSLFRQKLIKALPGCIIVPNGGACLGSGWLLLLMPFVGIILYIRKKIDNAAGQL